MATATEFLTNCYLDMNLGRIGEDVPLEAMGQMLRKYREVHAELVDMKIAYWPWDAIPLNVSRRLQALMQVEIAPMFGALPIVLAATGLPNQEAARTQAHRDLRIHREPEFNREYEPILEY